ncbi:polyketide cyclase/dehydrase/lipid transport protein [Prauserella shujinwangii]|uniref:Polyketide cyclase/dehydrase/lipid transport protein n=1 Tax=Prauserella shujinwangii TaxID=1453103 RepID=A0A2T0LSU4_9PSEU|nr:SRPBCC family protein [Prauserella shujinwangii]PRX46741.1 polyketide cyclase/dehydrase/lipid transport protein [Prauserella shujinwangii]
MPLTSYRFRTSWLIGAPARAVFATLVDLGTYPDWWPDVRSVSRVDDDAAEVTCRSMLPITLTLCLRRMEQDEPAGRLGVALTGDLEGSLSGVVRERDGGTRLDITQRVVARKPLLRALSPVAHPVFRANHAVMMRRGLRGLRAYLTTRPS